MAEYLDVLVLCSDPVNLRRTLNLSQELVHFEQVIRRSDLPIRLRRVFPPTLDQLQREFARATEQGRQPSVFHFLGHGDDDGLYFENEHGEAHLVKGHELKQALEQSPVKVVLLNACWSATKRGVSLIEFLTREQVADAAIGHETPVADVSAIEFARQFYSLITQGKTVREACQRAANSLAEQGRFGASDVKLVGNGETVLTAGLLSGSRPCVIESGLPKFGNLPESPVFYGRGEELVQLSQSFADAGLTGFGLWGIGGIGKTALAKVAARRNAWRYEGAVWVDIRDAVQKTTTELLRLALCRLHPGAPDADPAFELARRLQDAPSLIVLDNLEDLPESEHAALARFLQQVPRNGSRVLLTARVPLPAIERLPDVQSRRMTEGLDTWNGAHLVQHVAQQRQCLALKDELREVAGKPEGLCVLVTQRLHGHPMMLELAVGVALRGRMQLERALVELPDDLEQQLTALLATSLHYLGDDGNRVLPLLGFFPTGNLTPEALDVAGRSLTLRVEQSGELLDSESQATAGAEESDEESEPDLAWLARGREQLVTAGLLEYDQARDIYTFHQAILDEAHRRRPSDEVVTEIIKSLLSHYAEYVHLFQTDYMRLDRCIAEAFGILEVCWQLRTDPSPFDKRWIQVATYLGNYFRHRGWWDCAASYNDRAIDVLRDSSEAGDRKLLAIHQFQRGQLYAAQGDTASARSCILSALKHHEQEEKSEEIAGAWHQLASLEIADENASKASEYAEELLRHRELHGTQDDLGVAWHLCAVVEKLRGNLARSRELVQQAIHVQELGDPRRLAASLHLLATIELSDGASFEARSLFRRGIDIVKTIQDDTGELAMLRSLATIDATDGDMSEVRRTYRRVFEICECRHDRRALAECLFDLGRFEFNVANYSDAQCLFSRSATIHEGLGEHIEAALIRWKLAQSQIFDGNVEAGIELAQSSAERLEDLGSTQAEPIRSILAEMYVASRKQHPRLDEAISRLAEKTESWEKLSPTEQAEQLAGLTKSGGDPVEVVLTWLAHSVARWNRRDVVGCDCAITRAETFAASSGDAELSTLVAGARQQRAKVKASPPLLGSEVMVAIELLAQGEVDTAQPILEQAMAQAREKNDSMRIAGCQFYLGQIALKLDRPTDAVTSLREALELATQVGETDLIHAVQDVLTVATRVAENQ